jgi:hypothetical protein
MPDMENMEIQENVGLGRASQAADGTMPILEAQLRHIARTERSITLVVTPLIDQNELWFSLRVRLPNNARELHLVDSGYAERRWRQLNAMTRFIVQTCGRDRSATLDLKGVRPEMLFTRGQRRR